MVSHWFCPQAPLGPSRGTVYKLAALFSIDAFAGGFVGYLARVRDLSPQAVRRAMFSPTSERVIDTETTSAPTATKVAANHAGQTSHRRDAPPR